MVVHSEFFEFETAGEFDVVNATHRVEEVVRSKASTRESLLSTMVTLSKPNLNTNACETL